MKYALYDILLHLVVVALFPYFVLKMLTARKYREGIPERFGFIRKEKIKRLSGYPVVWIHAVSVGETKAILPVLRLFKERHPEVKVLFSTVTQTGNRTAEKDASGLIDALIYFPLDLSWVVKKVLREVRPKTFIVVEKEIWPNIFNALERSSVPIIVVNGTISDRSFRRFSRFRPVFKDIFGKVSFFCARTDEDRKRAIGSGVKEDRAETTGNIKFDIKPISPDEGYLDSLKKALDIKTGSPVIVAGSTHPGEEDIVLEAYKSLSGEFKGLKLILAPRHPERFTEVESLIKKTGLSYSRRSSGGCGDIVLLDTVGELLVVYSFATVAIVGGSLVDGIGGHNLLEPALFGKPVVYGPYLTSYLYMAEMLEGAGGGVRVRDGNELFKSLKTLLSDERSREKAGENARRVVEENRGAAKRTVEVIERFLARNLKQQEQV